MEYQELLLSDMQKLLWGTFLCFVSGYTFYNIIREATTTKKRARVHSTPVHLNSLLGFPLEFYEVHYHCNKKDCTNNAKNNNKYTSESTESESGKYPHTGEECDSEDVFLPDDVSDISVSEDEAGESDSRVVLLRNRKYKSK